MYTKIYQTFIYNRTTPGAMSRNELPSGQSTAQRQYTANRRLMRSVITLSRVLLQCSYSIREYFTHHCYNAERACRYNACTITMRKCVHRDNVVFEWSTTIYFLKLRGF